MPLTFIHTKTALTLQSVRMVLRKLSIRSMENGIGHQLSKEYAINFQVARTLNVSLSKQLRKVYVSLYSVAMDTGESVVNC